MKQLQTIYIFCDSIFRKKKKKCTLFNTDVTKYRSSLTRSLFRVPEGHFFQHDADATTLRVDRKYRYTEGHIRFQVGQKEGWIIRAGEIVPGNPRVRWIQLQEKILW